MRPLVIACSALLIAAACGGAPRVEPSPAPSSDPQPAAHAPGGPVLLEPEQLIFPPEDLPLAAEVARDAPIAAHGWERQFAVPASADFRWFTVRLFVNEPDITAARFVDGHGCGTITWPTEKPAVTALAAPGGGDATAACRYTFADGARVMYLTTGFRNVGIEVGTQPRRAEVDDALAVAWCESLARMQIAIIGDVLTRAASR